MHVSAGAHRSQSRVLDLPAAGVTGVMNYLTWVLGTEFWSPLLDAEPFSQSLLTLLNKGISIGFFCCECFLSFSQG